MPRSTDLSDDLGLEFSKRLQAALKAANMTQADLMRATGQNRSSVNAWTQGRKLPSFENLHRIAKATRQPVSFLVPDALHGSDSLDELGRRLASRLGKHRLAAVAHVYDDDLRGAIDSLLGRAIADGAIPYGKHTSSPARRKP